MRWQIQAHHTVETSSYVQEAHQSETSALFASLLATVSSLLLLLYIPSWGYNRSASILKNRRAVFNIKGNDYRLIVVVAYRYQAVYVKFIGTHAAYDAIEAEAIKMEP